MRTLVLIPILFALANAQAPDFAKDIAPLIAKRCGGCHGGEAKMGEYSVNTFAQIRKGGNHGNTLVPGKPDESLLYQMITGKAYPRMPMDGTILSDAETSLIRRWIEAGANGPIGPEAANVSMPADKAPEIRPRGEPKPQIFALAWQPGGNLIAIGRHTKAVLIDAATKREVAVLEGHQGPVRSLAFSADGKLLATGGGQCAQSGEVRIWSVDSRQTIATIRGHADCIYGLAFSPDRAMLATSSYDKLIKLWDPKTGKEIRTLTDHIDAVYALAFTPDSKRLVSGAADRAVKIWDTATGKRLYTFSEPVDGINTIAVDPTGGLVVAGGLDKSIRVWRMDANSGELLQSLMAHQDAILKLAFSPDGDTIASSSADRSVKLLRASDLAEMGVLPQQPDWAYGLAFSPDGRRLALGRMDGSFEIYELARFVDRRKSAAQR
jgi:WD40 repeat protein